MDLRPLEAILKKERRKLNVHKYTDTVSVAGRTDAVRHRRESVTGGDANDAVVAADAEVSTKTTELNVAKQTARCTGPLEGCAGRTARRRASREGRHGRRACQSPAIVRKHPNPAEARHLSRKGAVAWPRKWTPATALRRIDYVFVQRRNRANR